MGTDQKTKQSLDKILHFLKENKRWNSDYQMREYNWNLAHLKTPRERLLSLLHMSVNTQSQPKLAELAIFWRALYKKLEDQEITPIIFTKILEDIAGISNSCTHTWKRMFNALNVQSGWGEKTTALFIKSSIRIHEECQDIGFWESGEINPTDQIYLPVDAVIKHIFANLGLLKREDFRSINNLLSRHYEPKEMLIWDDLWFWGFFTQKIEDEERITVWNSEKFWCQRASPIQNEDKVRCLAKKFLEIIETISAEHNEGKP